MYSLYYIHLAFTNDLPKFFIKLFNNEADLITLGTHCMNIYFFGFFMMSLQMSAQSIYVALVNLKSNILFITS